jgi:hypothetical protein
MVAEYMLPLCYHTGESFSQWRISTYGFLSVLFNDAVNYYIVSETNL